MGQYHKIVNLDRREYIHPHRLGHGLKLWEFIPKAIGPMQALGLLLAGSNGRDYGDFLYKWDGATRTEPLSPDIADLIGRWAGDRIAIIGDYAEDGDTGRPYDEAENIYDLCCPENNREDVQWERERIPASKWFTDISESVRRAMTEVFGLQYHGDEHGWCCITGGLADDLGMEHCSCSARVRA